MHGEVEATRWIMEHGQPVIVKDIRENPFNSNDIFPDTGFHASEAETGIPGENDFLKSRAEIHRGSDA